MESIWIILGLTVFSMVLGFVWHGPLFGKKFAWANDWPDFDAFSPAEKEKAKKEAMPYYGLQAIATLIQMTVLVWFTAELGKEFALETALWLWLGFIVPVVASNVIWSMKPGNKKMASFLIIVGFQLVLMAVAGYVLSL
jgi:flagellar basal body-associated protein FliL